LIWAMRRLLIETSPLNVMLVSTSWQGLGVRGGSFIAQR